MENVKFKEWVNLWLEKKRLYVKESTYANYTVIVRRYLIPKLGGFNVEKITKEQVQQMIFEMRRNGKKDGKTGLSDKMVRDIIVVLKMCLKDSDVAEEWVHQKNVFHYPVDYEIKNNGEINSVTYEKILEAIYSEDGGEVIGYAIGVYTGMRIGEICALQWKDIDMKRKVISVKKTLQRIYLKGEMCGTTKVILGKPKSKAAVREIPISRSLEQKLERERGIDDECYVLSGTEKYIEPRLYRSHFDKFLKRNNVEHIRFHDLRHTFATNCIEKGADYKTVSCILGHSSVSITLNRYVHPKMEQKRRCVELI